MNPTDIGLPAKFTSFRPLQLEKAIAIAGSPKRWVINSEPTGGGKSIIAMTAINLLEARAVYVTANKGLQEQLERDFGGIGLTDIRGQSNYPCRLLTEKHPGFHGCDKGPCHFGKPCDLHPRSESYRPGCTFYDALAKARRSRLVVTNYDFWMSANRYMEPSILGVRDIVVFDEAHEAPDKLAEFCAVTLTAEDCDRWLRDTLPPVEDGVEAWVEWANKHRWTLESLAEWCRTEARHDEARECSTFIKKVEFLRTAHAWERAEPSEPKVVLPGLDTDWVGERSEDRLAATFSPVWAHRYAEKFLFCGIPKVVLVSATITRQTARYLGIPDTQLEFVEYPSSFHLERRPVYVVPTASIGRSSTEADYRAIITRIDQIIDTRLDRKGIIMVNSYDMAFKIRQGSRHARRIMWHKRDRLGPSSAVEVVRKFKSAGPGTILISPVVSTGYDFPYDDCEFIIIPKVPFIDLRPAVIQARARSDKKYVNYLAMLKIIQQAGRGMRAVDDQCETFILDDNFGRWFLPSVRRDRLIAPWFNSAIKMSPILPAPPQRINTAIRRGY